MGDKPHAKAGRGAFFEAMKQAAPKGHALFHNGEAELGRKAARIGTGRRKGNALACAILASSLSTLSACAPHVQQKPAPMVAFEFSSTLENVPQAELERIVNTPVLIDFGPAGNAPEGASAPQEGAAGPANRAAQQAYYEEKYANASREELEAAWEELAADHERPGLFVHSLAEAREYMKMAMYNFCSRYDAHVLERSKRYAEDAKEESEKELALSICEKGYYATLLEDRTIDEEQKKNAALLERVKEMLRTEGALPERLAEKMAEYPPCVSTETDGFFLAFFGKTLAVASPLSNLLLARNGEWIPDSMRMHFLLHEALHYLSYFKGGSHNVRWRDKDGVPRFRDLRGAYLGESNVELQAQNILRANKIIPEMPGYPPGLATLKAIEGIVGAAVLKEAAYSGDYTEVRKAFDSRFGDGAFEEIAVKQSQMEMAAGISKLAAGASEEESQVMSLIISGFSKSKDKPFVIGEKEFRAARQVAAWAISKSEKDPVAARFLVLLFTYRAQGAPFHGEALSLRIAKRAYPTAERLAREFEKDEGLTQRICRIIQIMLLSKKANGAIWPGPLVDDAVSIAKFLSNYKDRAEAAVDLTERFLARCFVGMDVSNTYQFIKKNFGPALDSMDTAQFGRFSYLGRCLISNMKFERKTAAAALASIRSIVALRPGEEDWVFETLLRNSKIRPSEVFGAENMEAAKRIAGLANVLEQRAPGTKSKVKYLLSDPKLELEDLADIEEVLKTCSPEKVIEQLEEFGYTIN